GDRGGHGGLAVGPGHPDGGEALGGAAVDQRGRERGGGTRIVDDQRGQSRRLAALPAGRVGEGHGGAAAGGLGGELRAVGGGTGRAHQRSPDSTERESRLTPRRARSSSGAAAPRARASSAAVAPCGWRGRAGSGVFYTIGVTARSPLVLELATGLSGRGDA